MRDNFFTQTHCDRCSSKLYIRTMSWFTNDTICGECSIEENKIKADLRANDDKTNYEGCGFIPEVKGETMK